MVSFVQGENRLTLHKEIMYRHIAWMTALRHQLRLSKSWEHTDERVKGLYVPTICEDYKNRLAVELHQFLSADELSSVKRKTNVATQILRIQSERLQDLRDQNHFDDFRHMEFHQLITNLYTEQGKTERIKNFPFYRIHLRGADTLHKVNPEDSVLQNRIYIFSMFYRGQSDFNSNPTIMKYYKQDISKATWPKKNVEVDVLEKDVEL